MGNIFLQETKMNKTILAIAAALAVVAAVFYFEKKTTLSTVNPVEEAWTQWKQTQGKSYGNNSEEQYRFGVFADNYSKVNAYNAAGNTATLTMNKFADLSQVEFKKIYTGYKKPATQNQVAKFATNNLKSSVNWVTSGAVGAVKNQ